MFLKLYEIFQFRKEYNNNNNNLKAYNISSHIPISYSNIQVNTYYSMKLNLFNII